MDPTFRAQVLAALSSIDAAHPDPEGADRPCPTCGDAMTEGRAQHLLDVIASTFAEAELAPRVVHVPEAKTRIERVKTFDQERGDKREPDGHDDLPVDSAVMARGLAMGTVVTVDDALPTLPYWGFDEEVPIEAPPTDCSDCGRGLTSRGEDLICPRLSMTTELKGCHQGCIVACGMEA